ERLGVLVNRLADVAAKLGSLADTADDSGLDRSRYLLGLGKRTCGALLGRRDGLLDEFARAFRHARSLQVLQRVGDRSEGLLEGVEQEIGFGGHGSLHPQLAELWAHPVRIGPGLNTYAMRNDALQHKYCTAPNHFGSSVPLGTADVLFPAGTGWDLACGGRL